MASHVDDNAVAQFVSITGAPSHQAQHFLAASNGDIESAVSSYYAAQEDPDHGHADDGDHDNESDDFVDDDDEPEEQPKNKAPPAYQGGGRRLGEGPSDSYPVGPQAEQPKTAKPKSKPNAAKRGGIATLGDLEGANRHDDSSEDEKQDLFAGGEKSGLAVHNPQDDLKKRILEKAQRRGPPPKQEPQKKSFFTGAARTLGGDDTPSQEIPAAPQPQQSTRVERTLHFWRDGFSVDDGDLYRNDDPRNAQLLQLIQQGRAPLAIMNVQPGQEVDVELKQHDENYVRPKKKYNPFDGQGNRLGSPTPGFQSTQQQQQQQQQPRQQQQMPGAFDSPSSVQVDESQPTVTLRVSLGSGTRVTSRFNTTHTVGDVYDFVRRQEPDGREFVLQTIFPTTELKDKSQVLGEMAEFKRGGAVVQRYI